MEAILKINALKRAKKLMLKDINREIKSLKEQAENEFYIWDNALLSNLFYLDIKAPTKKLRKKMWKQGFDVFKALEIITNVGDIGDFAGNEK